MGRKESNQTNKQKISQGIPLLSMTNLKAPCKSIFNNVTSLILCMLVNSKCFFFIIYRFLKNELFPQSSEIDQKMLQSQAIPWHQEEEILKHTHAHGSKNIMSKAILSLPRLDLIGKLERTYKLFVYERNDISKALYADLWRVTFYSISSESPLIFGLLMSRGFIGHLA